MSTPNDRDHEVSPEEPGRTAAWAAAIDYPEEGRRRLAGARPEIAHGELIAERAGCPRLATDCQVFREAIAVEGEALKTAMDRSVAGEP